MKDSEYWIDDYVSTTPGEPYRLFPFGTIYKGGKKRVIDRKCAESFKLPHFKPPIKLGSHEETTPAGGQIVALEVREDGLYAIPELVPAGEKALEDGAYRYHSPEVIWEDTGLEDPVTGKIVPGPMIIGDALLHTPHLGEAAALYTIEPIGKEHTMSDQVQIPQSLWDKFLAAMHIGAPVSAETIVSAEGITLPPPEIPEEFKAAALERDQLKAKLEQMEAEKIRLAAVADLVAQLQKQDDFGSSYLELAKATEAANMLSGMSPEQQAWCLRQFKAFAAQVKDSALFSEKGSDSAAIDDPYQAYDAAVKAYQAEKKTDYTSAAVAVAQGQPALYEAYRKASPKGKGE
jgi:hypothetical protein